MLDMWYYDTSHLLGRELGRLTFFISSLPALKPHPAVESGLTFELAQAFHHFAKAACQMFVPAQHHAEAARELRIQR